MNKGTKILFITIILLSITLLHVQVAAKNTYTVTYKATNGIFKKKSNSSKKRIIFKYKKNRKRGYAPSIKRSKYVFNGWYTKKKGGKKYTSKTRIKKSTTLYPHWIKRYIIKKQYLKSLGCLYKSEDEIEETYPNIKIIKKNTKYLPFTLKCKSSSFNLLFEFDYSDSATKDNVTYDYSLDTIKCPLKKIVNIKKQTNCYKFLTKLSGKGSTNHYVNTKKHMMTLAYGLYDYSFFEEDDNPNYPDQYYVLWDIKLTKKNKVVPSSQVTLSASEDNIVN